MTTSNPTSAHRRNASTAYSAEGMQPARVAPRRGSETKVAFKTTEFIVYVVAVIGVLLASFLVSTTDADEDYFRADRAWFYVVLLSIGYMVSRGLAKAGSRHHDDASSTCGEAQTAVARLALPRAVPLRPGRTQTRQRAARPHCWPNPTPQHVLQPVRNE
jgi:hypothetical protein